MNIESAMDKASFWLKRAIDILLLHSPLKTALGILIGYLFGQGVNLFRPTLVQIHTIDINAVPFYTYTILGIVLMHIGTIKRLRNNESVLPEKLQQALDLIDRTVMTPEQKQILYKRVVEAVLNELNKKDRDNSKTNMELET